MQNLKEIVRDAFAGLPTTAPAEGLRPFSSLSPSLLRLFMEKASVAVLTEKIKMIRAQLSPVSSRLAVNLQQRAEVQSRIESGNVSLGEMKDLLVTRSAIELLIEPDRKLSGTLQAQLTALFEERSSRQRDRDLLLRERTELAKHIDQVLSPPVAFARQEVEKIEGWVSSQEGLVDSTNRELAEQREKIAEAEEGVQRLDAQLIELNPKLEQQIRERSQLELSWEPLSLYQSNRLAEHRRSLGSLTENFAIEAARGVLLNNWLKLRRTEFVIGQSCQTAEQNLGTTRQKLLVARARLQELQSEQCEVEKQLAQLDDMLSKVEGN